MSLRIFTDDVLWYQQLLKASGYYIGTLDGIWGPRTSAADRLFLHDAEVMQENFGRFDDRSEACIGTLHIKAQRAARGFMRKAVEGSLRCIIISGTRTYAEQTELYRHGRWGDTRPKVTNARAGQSNHNFAIAWDVGLFSASGRYLDGSSQSDNAAYADLANLVASEGLEWGGNWTGFKDRPHYQLASSLTIGETRDFFERGLPYV